ncbi:prolipoprotein diacylglyceryl transferase [Alicyclobacillus sp. ALC3]|uniref:prolipoprotein diacylglyceryl transferase n=1 Tax=Alicyclobacillus sp. ALC3 TaxID=2796143 RepID=UPI002378E28F|nr:prolipoprotein diacylglyceryl transferase [Alicyclobacillus sp. ALC3]WDL96644.1 prolipoprotein diacylglyceryl transferase [Alicyclobacillus sp. ALC3]
MHPILFHVGSFPVRAYGLVILLAIFLATQVSITLVRLTVKEYEQHIVPLVYSVVIGALIGARVWQVFFFTPTYYFAHPGEMLAIWNGGLSIQGGIVGGLIVGIWYCRRHHLPFWHVADLLAPSIILGQGIGRIACLLNGDAFGAPTGGNFGLVYPPGTLAYETYGSQPLWPAEVFEGQMDIVIFAILFALLRKKLPRGMMFLLYNILYSAGRFGLEFLRGDSPRFLLGWTAAQWTSMVVVALALIMIMVLRGQDRPRRVPVN